MKYAIKEPLVKDGIYVYKDDNNEYHRIKALMSLRGVRVFRIDTGNYDVTKTDAIFYITRHFLRLNPIVFRASLGRKLRLFLIYLFFNLKSILLKI